VEYNQLDPLLKTTPTGGDVPDKTGFSPYPGNINVLVFKLPNYTKCLDRTNGIVQEFVNPKWQDDSRMKFKSPTRLECMMQDFPMLCGPEDKMGFSQLERQMCFTCVKNNLTDAAKKNPPDCALSAEADIYACNARLLSLAGPEVEIAEPAQVDFLGIHALIGARIVLMPSWGISLEDMKSRVKGPLQISGKSVLVLDGDVVLEGLDLDGALVVRGTGETGGKVHNAGCPLVAIPAAELDAQPAFMKIRGYQVLEGETEVRELSP
jgi:UDP-sugar pyrophosphorylase